MTINILDMLKEKGCPIDKQKFTWKEMAGPPISKLDDDAFTRVRIILMNGLEVEALRLKHFIARCNKELQVPLARVRRSEQHQATTVNWLLSADHSPLETTIAYEQVAIEVTAAVAQSEPDPYQAQTYRFGLLEDFDHLYRYAAMLDRLEGKDANTILQGYTDIVPGRLTTFHHRAPIDDVRDSYNKNQARLITKIHAAMITAAEYQTHDYYMNIGPTFTDPLARQLYAEIASVEEQHVTQYGSLMDPEESLIEKWILQETSEIYAYLSCLEQETNSRIKQIWERFLDYEIGHLHIACEMLKKYEERDPAEILEDTLPQMVQFKSQRDFVRAVLREEVDLRTDGSKYVPESQESKDSIAYREQMHSKGVPAEIVSGNYKWVPGTELNKTGL